MSWKCISESKIGGDAVIAAKGKKLGASMEVSTLVHKNKLEDGVVKFVQPLEAEKVRLVVFGVPPTGWDPEEREGKRERNTKANMAGLLALNYTVSSRFFSLSLFVYCATKDPFKTQTGQGRLTLHSVSHWRSTTYGASSRTQVYDTSSSWNDSYSMEKAGQR